MEEGVIPSTGAINAMVDSIMTGMRQGPDGVLRPHGIHVWQCKLCGKFFHTKPNLVSHVNMHLGFQPFQCGSCGRGFYHKGSLQKHIKTGCV